MGEPRWTIDTGPVLVWNDRVLPIPIEWPGGMDAYDALVAAVRDADTLRQARALADELTFDNGEASWQDLLDLLVPDVPATPTPQGPEFRCEHRFDSSGRCLYCGIQRAAVSGDGPASPTPQGQTGEPE